MVSHGECWTLNSAEFHSAAAVCSLSDILETGDHLRPYYLSDTALRGIRNRAAGRGKDMPELLDRLIKEALDAR